jgi:hypothetical protein
MNLEIVSLYPFVPSKLIEYNSALAYSDQSVYDVDNFIGICVLFISFEIA